MEPLLKLHSFASIRQTSDRVNIREVRHEIFDQNCKFWCLFSHILHFKGCFRQKISRGNQQNQFQNLQVLYERSHKLLRFPNFVRSHLLTRSTVRRSLNHHPPLTILIPLDYSLILAAALSSINTTTQYRRAEEERRMNTRELPNFLLYNVSF